MITNLAVANGTSSQPLSVQMGSLVTVTPAGGASVTVQYTLGSRADVANNVAVWTNWPKGVITALTTDLTKENVFVRVQPSGGTATLTVNDLPTAQQIASYNADFASAGLFQETVTVNINNSSTIANLTNPLFQAVNTVDNYTQIASQNKSATINSSADIIAYPDNVNNSDLTGFADMGMTSSAYAQAAYSVTGPNEAYLFGSAPTGSGASGDFVHATDASGTSNGFRWYTNGFNKNITAWAMRIVQSGMLMIGAGLSLSNLSKVIANVGAAITYTVPAGASYVNLTTSGASMATTFPSAAALLDGLMITITPGASVATATWISTGATFVGAPAALTANVPVRFIYDHPSLKWYLM